MRTGRPPKWRKVKWPREHLVDLTNASKSYSELIRRLGCQSYSGTLHAHLKRRLQEQEISTAHFIGVHVNKGRQPACKRPHSEILKYADTAIRREHTHVLRRAMIEVGVQHVCSGCSINSWNGKSLVLDIDHRDGDWRNNRIENLRFLCPNCHSQTETFRNRGKKS